MAAKKFDENTVFMRIRDLPVIPTAVAEIIKIANDPGSSATDVEWAINRDQAVAGKVLKLVNSAAYGFSRRVETIRQAVVMLGLRKLRDIAISMAGSELFAGLKDDKLVDGVGLWTHGLAAMLWSRFIINQKRWVELDAVVTAALMHDIGIVILYQYAKDIYAEVLSEAARTQKFHERLERKMLKTTHAKIGASLCAKWRLPIAITQLISQHHSVLTPAEPAVGILMLADHLAFEMGFPPFSWSVPPSIPSGLNQLLELNDHDINEIHEALPLIRDQVLQYRSIIAGNGKDQTRETKE
ncbi:MAG: HDOD domain-containing protein [Lentisphaerae bacterium]|nr:MAG: HDOD domain-containing protein [Lentisphaerota bacterium]